MTVKSTVVLTAALAILAGRQLSAQFRDMGSATPLHVRVHAASVVMSGDTARVSYVVDNLSSPSSGEDFWLLLVDAPAPPLQVSAMAGQWSTNKEHGGRPTADWTLEADTLIHPGQSTPQLTFSAIGIPDTVRYWAVPDLVAHPPVDDDRNYHVEPLKAFADSGLTVGIVPPPSTSASELLSRLRGLVSYACGSAQWINDATVCSGLASKLDTASTALAAGNPTTAKGAVSAFIQQLDAQHGTSPGKHVSDDAYALLRPNAVYVRDRMAA